MKNQRGITIIEVVLYMGLLSIILSSGVLILFQIIEGDARREQAILVQQEGDFILGKFDVIMMQDVVVSSPVSGQQGSMLAVGVSPDEISLFQSGEKLMIKRGVNAAQPLNSSSAPLINLNFENNPADDDSSGMLVVSFTLGGKDFTRTYHISL